VNSAAASTVEGAEVQRLSHIDEHTVTCAASRERTWAVLLDVAEGAFSLPVTRPIARGLGCADVAASGPRPLMAGSAFPGFHVLAAERPSRLTLAGQHRFSTYALIFRLEELGPERTRLRAETRAEFPGIKGRFYRAVVIGTRGHVIVTRRLIATVATRAAKS
jgi:hypothetical protein